MQEKADESERLEEENIGLREVVKVMENRLAKIES